MKIKFLGTAAAEGIPAFFCTCNTCKRAREIGGKEIRTRSQTLLDESIMIDFPADTYFHSIRDNINLTDIHHYVITHCHMDHFHPDDVSMLGYGYANFPEDMPVYNFYGGAEMVEKLTPLANKLPKRLALHTLQAFEKEDIGIATIIPLKAAHGTETPFIYIIEKDGKRILYAHDTGLLPQETEEYLFKHKPYFDLITIDCCAGTKGEEMLGLTHLCFRHVKQICEKMRKENMIDEKTKLIVNHFSHNDPNVLYESRTVYEQEGYIMSHDGLEIEF